jgi:lysozyme family protein
VKFDEAVDYVLDFEGRKFSNVPGDPGGATCFGIIQTEYDRYRAKDGLPQQSVEKITPLEVNAIYKGNYWKPMRCGELYPPIDFVLFQAGVNIGNRTAIGILENLLGESATVCDRSLSDSEVTELNTDPHMFSIQFLLAQKAFYADLVYRKPQLQKFLDGWYNRVNKTAKICKLEDLA